MRVHIVVTGCTGFSGSHLTDRLPANGRIEVGLDSFARSHVCMLRGWTAGDDTFTILKRR